MAFSANAHHLRLQHQLVRTEDVPKSALDFLKPAFQGKLISVYPHDDDAALYLFHLIVQKYGWDWMDQIHGQQAALHPGPSAGGAQPSPRARWPPRSTRPSPRPGTLKRAGRADRGGVLGRGRDAGVHASPAASSRTRRIRTPPSSISDLVSGEGAADAARHLLAARSTCRRREGFKPLTSYKIANAFREFITDDKLIADLRKRFEALHRPGGEQGRGEVNAGGAYARSLASLADGRPDP